MTLAEPPVVFAGGELDEKKEHLLKEASAAFEKGDAEDAVRTIVNSSREGAYEQVPEPYRKRLLRNARELQALVTSDDMYPGLDRNAVRKIALPTLLLSGERSSASQKLVDDELERLLPETSRQRVVIRDADHGMWFQQPEACLKATLDFLRGK
jgi:pimeloyl-ACP methyl ester carboxylesterase